MKTKSILHTGGAEGADSVWAHRAGLNKHEVKIYSFDGWKRTRLINDEGNHDVIHLDLQEEELSNLALEEAAKNVNKILPATGYNRNLLKRDYCMIRDADSLYAIGHFSKDSGSRLKIKGHTSWIVEMFLNHLISKDPNIHHDNCMVPIYFFSEEESKWYQLHHTKKDNFRWIAKGSIFTSEIEKPSGNYIGVGSRDLGILGRNALLNL